MDEPEAEIRLRAVWVVRLGGDQPESTSGMEGLWLAGEESGFLEVDLKCL